MTKIIHGVALNIFNTGVLITGDSAIGKSELALELIDRGHKFIADDSVKINCQDDNVYVIAQNSYIHIRGIGFMDVAQMFSSSSIVSSNKLDLVIELTTNSNLLNDSSQLISTTKIENVSITKFTIPINSRRNIALLVELIVRYYKEQQLGYDCHKSFNLASNLL